jgi:hypothetical protein
VAGALQSWHIRLFILLFPVDSAAGEVNYLQYLQPVAGFEVALAAEPVFHRGLQAMERYAVAGFEHAVGNRKRVVKNGVVGEVAHGEVVDPLDGAGVALACRIDSLNGELAREHDASVAGPA